jgi:hypothetical protein
MGNILEKMKKKNTFLYGHILIGISMCNILEEI